MSTVTQVQTQHEVAGAMLVFLPGWVIYRTGCGSFSLTG